ncbi:MAG: protein kinase, partial [Planctomycetes bacterium]|nr:protein kinase [Planctomycetota bacterium]
MSPTPDIQELFHRALELAEGERQAFVDVECAGDDALRARLMKLLASDDSDSWVPRVAGEPDGAVEWIGPYRILGRIGEGGMGEVYLAEQREPFRRRVALKVLKAGMDSKAFIARFEAERQALALMEHSGIARVYDAGVAESGQPFLVLEYVKVDPITTYCDQKKLTIESRLGLFMDVCAAIQHAQTKCGMHRDLKPSN